MATAAAGNWNNPDCGEAYNNARASVVHPPTSVYQCCIHLRASHAPPDQWDSGDLGARRTIEDTLTVISANVLGFSSPTVHKRDPKVCVQCWGLGQANQRSTNIFLGSMYVAESGSMQGSCEPQQLCFPCKYFMSLFVLKSWKDILISKVLEKWWSVMMWAFQFCAMWLLWRNEMRRHSYTNTWECAMCNNCKSVHSVDPESLIGGRVTIFEFGVKGECWGMAHVQILPWWPIYVFPQ